MLLWFEEHKNTLRHWMSYASMFITTFASTLMVVAFFKSDVGE